MIKRLVEKFCEQTSVHGVCDLYYAKSSLAKLFWTLIIFAGTGMTGYQMYHLVITYQNNPVKTEITTLSRDAYPKYPPYLFGTTYFNQWVDLNKVISMTIQLDSFLYFMSYFYPIYTRFRFNVTEAEHKLIKIMEKINVTDLYDLSMLIAYKTPPNILSKNSFHRFMSQNGEFVYIVKPKYYTNENFLKANRFEIYMTSYASFENTQFYEDFRELYNYSLKEDYSLYIANSDTNLINNSTQFSSPTWINVVGDKNTYIPIDVYLNDYDFFLQGILYNWIPSNERKCRAKMAGEEKYYVECRMECAKEYKFFNKNSCKIYFLNDSANFDTFSPTLRSSCHFNEKLLKGTKRDIATNTTFGNDSYNLCLSECMSSCKDWNFQFQEVSYPRRGIQDQAKILGKISLTYQQKDSMLVISLLPAFSWNEVLSGIGGLLGLWLGGSIISFIQIIYIFICIPLESWLISRYNKARKSSIIIKPIEIFVNETNQPVTEEKYTKIVSAGLPNYFENTFSAEKNIEKNQTIKIEDTLQKQMNYLQCEIHEIKSMITSIALKLDSKQFD